MQPNFRHGEIRLLYQAAPGGSSRCSDLTHVDRVSRHDRLLVHVQTDMDGAIVFHADLRGGNRTVIVILYRWRLHPGAEKDFVQAWSRVSDLLRSRGSLGSRLHQGSDGLWYGYAQWPSAQARKEAFALGSVDALAGQQMQAAIAECLPEIVLDPVADYIVPLGRNGG